MHGDALRKAGFSLEHQFLSPDSVEFLLSTFIRDGVCAGVERAAGVRNVLALSPTLRTFATTGPLAEIARRYLGRAAFPVRGILFDKSSFANWGVPFHQDISIPVRRRMAADGFGPWSIKDGVQYVQPPPEVLEQMLTLRLHFDDADELSGPLLAFPGSHSDGILEERRILALQRSASPVACLARSGDLLLMRPLLVHGSNKAMHPTRRRVLHIEYAAEALPAGLEWAQS